MGGRNAIAVSISVLALTLLFASCASAPVRAGPRPDVLSSGDATGTFGVHDCDRSLTAVVDATLETRVWVQTNRVRREAGVAALDLRLDLVEVARRHALDMASRGYFSHISPEGENPGERAVRGGARFSVYAEILARVRHAEKPVALAVEAWLSSPGHRRSLLDESEKGYRYTGIGVARSSDGTILIAQVFLR